MSRVDDEQLSQAVVEFTKWLCQPNNLNTLVNVIHKAEADYIENYHSWVRMCGKPSSEHQPDAEYLASLSFFQRSREKVGTAIANLTEHALTNSVAVLRRTFSNGVSTDNVHQYLKHEDFKKSGASAFPVHLRYSIKQRCISGLFDKFLLEFGVKGSKNPAVNAIIALKVQGVFSSLAQADQIYQMFLASSASFKQAANAAVKSGNQNLFQGRSIAAFMLDAESDQKEQSPKNNAQHGAAAAFSDNSAGMKR